MNEILDVIFDDNNDSDIELEGESSIQVSTDWEYESEDNAEAEYIFVTQPVLEFQKMAGEASETDKLVDNDEPVNYFDADEEPLGSPDRLPSEIEVSEVISSSND